MQKIDVEKILRSKSPSLASIGLLVRYLKRIVHQDEVNSFLSDFDGLPPLDFIEATLDRMGITFHASGMGKLPKDGRYIFVSNHPFGGIDGLMLAVVVGRYFGDVRVVVNDLLMNLTPISPLFIPVNKHGSQSVVYANEFNEAFNSDLPIITFPAGLCSRRRKGVVTDPEWKPNFVKRAITSRRDIVPVFFGGRLSDRFYNLSNLRTGLGIKANIEMLYLADEMFRQKGQDFDIQIGYPVSWQSLEDRPVRDVALEIREKAYSLKNIPDRGQCDH